MPWWLWTFFIILALIYLYKKGSTSQTDKVDAPQLKPSSPVDRARASAAAQAGNQPHVWPELGLFDFPVTGETYYQPALKQMVGETNGKLVRKPVIATLKLEDDNAHDSNAVAVLIDGQKVGHLSRENAVSFRRRLGALKIKSKLSTCNAQIKGGGINNKGETREFDVWLDLKPFNS